MTAFNPNCKLCEGSGIIRTHISDSLQPGTREFACHQCVPEVPYREDERTLNSIAILSRRIEKLEKALLYYTEPRLYRKGWDWAQGVGQVKLEPEILKDKGATAKKALKEDTCPETLNMKQK